MGEGEDSQIESEARLRELTLEYDAMRQANAVVHAIRGEFLATMIDAEHYLDKIIIDYFRPDEFDVFERAIIGQMNFLSKLRAMRAILEDAKLWDSHRSVHRLLNGLREDRNRFAHLAATLLDHSHLQDTGNFEVSFQRRGLISEAEVQAIDMVGLRSLVEKARRAVSETLELALLLAQTHQAPDTWFHRSGWDPHPELWEGQ